MRYQMLKGFFLLLLVIFCAVAFFPEDALAVRVLAISANSGNRCADQAFSSGDLTGSITRLSNVSTFNAMSVDALRADYDVILVTWSSSASLNLDWATRLLPFLQKGGGVIWEDPNNVADLAAAVNASGGSGGTSTVSASVAGLTDGITNQFANNHIRFNSWASFLNPFLYLSGNTSYITGLYGEVSGGGRIVLTGPDQDYHGNRNGSGASKNQYNLLLNELKWASSGKPIPEPATMVLLGSGIAGMALYRRRRQS